MNNENEEINQEITDKLNDLLVGSVISSLTFRKSSNELMIEFNNGGRLFANSISKIDLSVE